MPTDLFILNILGRPRTILDKQYSVAWDCLQNKAIIMYTQEGSDDVYSLTNEDDETILFDSELKAHEYLTNLGTLRNTNSPDWRTI